MKAKPKTAHSITSGSLNQKGEQKHPCPCCGEECIALLGGMLAGLCMVRDIKDVREAVQWWSRNSKGWLHFASFAAREKAAKDA